MQSAASTTNKNELLIAVVEEQTEEFYQESSLVEVASLSTSEESLPQQQQQIQRDEERERIERQVSREDRNAKLCKSVFLLLLSLCGSIFVCFGYAVFNNQARYQFAHDFVVVAETIQAAAHYQLGDVYKSSAGLANAVSFAAVEDQQEWPFVTDPAFDFRSNLARASSGIDWIGYAPLLWNVSQLNAWGPYSVDHQHQWLSSTLQIPEHVYRIEAAPDKSLVKETGQEGFPVAPFWQQSPATIHSVVNFNGLSEPWLLEPFHAIANGGSKAAAIMSQGTPAAELLQLNNNASEQPYSLMTLPMGSGTLTTNFVGILMSILPWAAYLELALPSELEHGVQCVLRSSSSCSSDDGNATFDLVGSEAVFVGYGDLHDELFDSHKFVISMDPNELGGGNASSSSSDGCLYSFSVYPTADFEAAYQSRKPLSAAVTSGCLILALAIAFYVYEYFVGQKIEKVLQVAARSNKIISTLFPSNVRDRLFDEHDNNNHEAQLRNLLGGAMAGGGVQGAAPGDVAEEESTSEMDPFVGKPIADLFTDTTILFADIVGFTAWSSVREPAQVFTLLETLYHAFDVIADQRRVFKVETVGDCYVAVTGLPDPRVDHAVVMARFATDCLNKMHDLTRRLEVELGPDTGDLSMRFGLHSGPVTAGVLRGQRSRFQLFGDTMNTASRMETTSVRGRIQLSGETADLLVGAGKGHWIHQREDLVFAKGKGEMQTYFLDITGRQSRAAGAGSTVAMSTTSRASSDDGRSQLSKGSNSSSKKSKSPSEAAAERSERLIGWTVEVLRKLLKQIAARREASRGRKATQEFSAGLTMRRNDNVTVVEEVTEVITLPAYDARIALRQRDPQSVRLDPNAERQLVTYVTEIVAMYRNNPFHCFEHVAHVVMSVRKLLSRIVAPNDVQYDKDSEKSIRHIKSKARKGDKDLEKFMNSIAHETVGTYVGDHKKKTKRTKTLHDHTYGITSDPLTQFACVFSALIHDVDHTGVPNGQLIKENPSLAATYKNQSVAEQVSVDLAWNRLMDDEFGALRAAIYYDHTEMRRFRQLVVNSVMATDIMDKDLKELRNARWDVAFAVPTTLKTSSSHGPPPSSASMSPDADDLSSSHSIGENHRVNINRKATIVIEHIIQASDVSHTMQHWHVYRQWNEKLFREMSWAFVQGRAEKDPVDFWYHGEIGFFDFYIIPLARKLKNCGVFGVSSAEYLNYALLNRQEWELRGRDAVAEMKENFLRELAETQKANPKLVLLSSITSAGTVDEEEAEPNPAAEEKVSITSGTTMAESETAAEEKRMIGDEESD